MTVEERERLGRALYEGIGESGRKLFGAGLKAVGWEALEPDHREFYRGAAEAVARAVAPAEPTKPEACPDCKGSGRRANPHESRGWSPCRCGAARPAGEDGP